MKFNGIILAALFLLSIPPSVIGQSFKMEHQGGGRYEFEITGLERLDRMEPWHPEEEPRYELFIQVGDGYYTRYTMDNPASTESKTTITHDFGPRVPKQSEAQIIATPIYSPNRRPVRMDNVTPGSTPMEHDGNASTWSTSADGMISGSVKADLNWSSLEAEDEFIVIAGYSLGDSTIDLPGLSGQVKQLNFVDGGILSVYYDRTIVEPVPNESELIYNVYQNTELRPQDFGPDDKVLQDYSGFNLNAHIDFEFPLPQFNSQQFTLDDEFIFPVFQVREGVAIGETGSFPIVVVLRDNFEGSPSEDYLADEAEGNLVYGKDPNQILGLPRPICLADSTIDSLTYKIEFFNQGPAIVDEASFRVLLPEHISMKNINDYRLVSARFGDPRDMDLAESDFSIEAIVNPAGRDELIVTIKEAKVRTEYGNPPTEFFPMTYLNAYESSASLYFSAYYLHCSAEFVFRFERDKSLDDCGEDIPIRADLEVEFPTGVIVKRSDEIPCDCGEEPETCSGFCNIFPSIPFLGGCCCTPLLILLLLVIVYLVVVVWRNSRQQP